MSGTRTKKGIILAAIGWISIAAVIAVSYRFVVAPMFRHKLIEQTGSSNQVYKHEINFGIDSFSGYAALRSKEFKKEMDAQGIKINFVDDKADYAARLKGMQDRQLEMGVFTIDSLIKTSVDSSDMPGAIVLVIDETSGADAIVAYKQGVSSVQDLNTAGSTIYLTPNSPSETLARIFVANFNLPNLPQKFYTEEESAEKVLRIMRQGDKQKKVAYALWEPYVTQALNDDSVQVILDSSKLRGYILDVLVVERKFLKDNPAIVRSVVESYLRVSYSLSKKTDGYLTAVIDDSKQQGSSLTKHQAENIVKGLVWKNTLENYAHFGLITGDEGGNLPNMDRMISNIIGVLVKTGAIAESNFLTGREKSLYNDGILRDIQASKFRPDMGQTNIIDAVTGDNTFDLVRGNSELKKLSEEEWRKLVVVGELRIEPITFGRGKSTLGSQAQRDLKDLAQRLETFPNYYLIVVGNARSDGDIEIAMKLAQDRATATSEYLIQNGVNPNRLKIVSSKPSGSSGNAQTVSFVVGQLPY